MLYPTVLAAERVAFGTRLVELLLAFALQPVDGATTRPSRCSGNTLRAAGKIHLREDGSSTQSALQRGN